jgi:hypothetical protein
MTLNDTYYLKRTGRYANPLNSNDRLPEVYGDLTDGSSGNWIAPCIDTVNYVYCYAAHEVLSAANGNTIIVYKDGVVVPSGYTFSHSNNYESEGVISTITFTTDQASSVISVQGKGKPTTSGGSTLMTNIVDIAADFLTVSCGFTSSLFNSTKQAKARQVFTAAAYKAAGVIHQDINIWTLQQQKMSSFLGIVYLDAMKTLCFEIDDGTINENDKAAIFRKANTHMASAEQSLDNIINQCPCSYGYDYVQDNDFKHHTDDMAHVDAQSQSDYGVRTPSEPYKFYWCRDLTNVQAVQDIIVSKFKNPLWDPVVFEEYPAENVHVDIGDLIIASMERLYDRNGESYKNHLWKVLSVSPDDPAGKIRYTVQDTGRYLYGTQAIADGTYTADGTISAGSARDMTDY